MIETITFDTALPLEMGGELVAPTVAYSQFGTLNEDKSNVIVVCHALTANSDVSDWWNGLFGSGKLFDPDEYFIICINNLGSPYGTSSPKSEDPNGERYGMDFPSYTLRDTASLHRRFLSHLGIEKIHLLAGGSCGGNIAQELAIMMGDQVNEMIIMCCSAYETPWVISIHESQRMAIEADNSLYEKTPEAGRKGLRGARAFALPFYRSHPSFKIRQSEDNTDKVDNFKASSYVRYQGEKFINRYDAHCYYKQLSALDTHHIARGRETVEKALAMISAKTLVIGFSTDLLIPIIEQEIIANHIPDGSFAVVETQFGHDAFLIETDAIQSQINLWRNKKV